PPGPDLRTSFPALHTSHPVRIRLLRPDLPLRPPLREKSTKRGKEMQHNRRTSTQHRGLSRELPLLLRNERNRGEECAALPRWPAIRNQPETPCSGNA